MSNSPESTPPSLPPLFTTGVKPAGRLKVFAMYGFGILLVGAVAVVLVLPGLSSKRPPSDPTAPVADSFQLEMPMDSSDQTASLKSEAQDALQDILKHQARLENQGINIWGAERLTTSYGEVLDLLGKADTDSEENRFEQALEGYRNASKALEQLVASRPERVQRAINAGDEAFAQLDNTLAIQHYEIALAADTANSAAQAGLQRAQKLPQVLKEYTQGQMFEGNGELNQARLMYSQALSLDDRFEPARKSLLQVETLIEEGDLRGAMSAFLTTLEHENIDRARQALDTIKQICPDMSAISDLEQQLKNIKQRVELKRLKKQGLQYEQAEKWEMAAKVYSEALKIDSHARFAQQGKTRAEEALKLNKQVQAYLLKPEDLSAREHRAHALQVYQVALAKSENAPKLREKTEKLHQLFKQYSEKITVHFKSDNLTEVRIYCVGRLGKFSERRLKMYPGKYKMLGVRSGYRDVLVSFEVLCADKETQAATIYCKDKI